MSSARLPAALAATSLALASGGCLSSPDETVSAITDGTIDTADPDVVALMSGTTLYCAGTLVAPRVVVTAGHCVADIRPDRVLVGNGIGGRALAVAEAFAHPGFDRRLLRDDVGVVVLSAPAPVAPAIMWSHPFDGSFIGQGVRLVGFGLTSATDRGPLTKRQGTTTIREFTDVDFTFHPDPSQTCAGDSGGAAFMTIAGSEYLIGITSAGDLACMQYGTDMRVDAFLTDFIQPRIRQAEPAAADLGQRCYGTPSCSAGTCVSPSDAPHVQYCTNACGRAADCPASMICAQDASGSASCQYPRPSPGALGTSCATNSDCDSYLCALPGDGASTGSCSLPCRPGAPACPSGFDCAQVAGLDPHACLPAPATGCSVGETGVPSGLVMLGALLAVTSAVRRARAARTRRARAIRRSWTRWP